MRGAVAAFGLNNYGFPLQISREKLLPILESAIVNIVNMTGVDINKAIREPNYRVLLPYVSGLGPRKASGMVRRITAAVSVAQSAIKATRKLILLCSFDLTV